MFDERTDGIEWAVEVMTAWLDGSDADAPLSWNPPRFAGLWVWCLAANLATAAGLCAAFKQGTAYGAQRVVADWNGGGWEYPFSPGCGKPAPGMDRESGGGASK